MKKKTQSGFVSSEDRSKAGVFCLFVCLFFFLVKTSPLSQANQCFGPRSISVSLLKVPVITELLRFYWIMCQREGPGAQPLACPLDACYSTGSTFTLFVRWKIDVNV